jgi:hypothetical protein
MRDSRLRWWVPCLGLFCATIGFLTGIIVDRYDREN